MAVIEVDGLRKSYGGARVLDDVSFRVEAGRISGLLGPNGAGKSTVMRMMVGLACGEGVTRFDGQRYEELERPVTRVGVLIDSRRTHPRRSVGDHLRMIAAGARLSPARVDVVLEQVGLSSRRTSSFRNLSLGMTQRLGLAAALLGDPDTLILDEPANGLDPQGMEWLRELLRDQAEKGRAVLVSSHLLADVELMADDVVIMAQGKVVAASTLDAFVRGAPGSAVLVRADEPERLTVALTRRGGQLRTVDGRLEVRGLDQRCIAEVAAFEGCFVEELFAQPASLERAFLAASEETAVEARSVVAERGIGQ